MVTNNEVAHEFAHKRPAKSGSMRSDGEILYSYSAPIAQHLCEGAVLLSSRCWSVTTSRHQGLVSMATSHLMRIYTQHDLPEYAPGVEYARRLAEELADSYIESMEASKRARKYAAYRLDEAETKLKQLEFVIDKFNLDQNDELAVKARKRREELKEELKKARIEAAMAEQERVAKWKSRESVSLYGLRNTYLRVIEGGIVETSKGIKIPLKLVRKLVSKYDNTGEKPESVMDFPVTSISLNRVVIGCHDIEWSEIREVLAS